MDLKRVPDLELLGMVVGKRSARRLYRGTLASAFESSFPFLETPPRLQAAKELVVRLLHEDLTKGQIILSSPGQVSLYLLAYFTGQEHESFVILYLSAQNRLIKAEECFRGTLTQTPVYPREVVKQALRYNAAAVVFAHNHPSGISEPSRADESITLHLKQALDLIDVKVLDHFIIAGAEMVSMAERGVV